MHKLSIIFIILIFTAISACNQPDPNVDKTGENELKSHEIEGKLDQSKIAYQDIFYVPIYSDIYVDGQNQETLLAATLSIRNTSSQDSLFISRIDYFDTGGGLVKHYLEKPIIISPMATINYVIEREDDKGGSGANFIVELSAKTFKIKPLIQAVMIGEYSNKAFAFSTDGYSLIK